MSYLEDIIRLCQSYRQHVFDIAEFQSRLQTARLPDKISKRYFITLHNLCNDLEEVIYFYPKSEHQTRATAIADQIIEASLIEQTHLSRY